ncbi:MAG TPA: aspartate aminotransferase family protein [Dongiaceae bacterium]|jgi:ornithine--oxo-acid transaminase|nr:aspartate aminotransferase family protein [Dongiaceae bacterium]
MERASAATSKYDLHEQYLNHQMVRVLRTIGFDVDFQRGSGPHLYDAKGDKYLDLLSGFGVFALGRNHPKIIAALADALHSELPGLVQMDVSHSAGLLGRELLRRMPAMEKIFFCNSGAEAVESAIKFARAATGKPTILHWSHAFHGLTYGALSLNGDAIFRKGFEPLLPATKELPFNDLFALEAALREGDVAAFIFEPVQGKGVNIPSAEFVAGAAQLCKKYGALLIADEVQTGLGRTGKFLAIEHWGIEPDMILLAKSLSGGFVPVGAVAMKKWIFAKTFDRMDKAMVHGSTFGKNELAMAAGLATLRVMDEENIVSKTAQAGERLLAGLRQATQGMELVKDVRGLGLMIGIEFGRPEKFMLRAAWDLLEKAGRGLFCQLVIVPLFKHHKILVQVAGNDSTVIKLLPSLVIDETDEKWITDSFSAAIADTHRVPGAVWDFGRQLAANMVKTRMTA